MNKNCLKSYLLFVTRDSKTTPCSLFNSGLRFSPQQLTEDVSKLR